MVGEESFHCSLSLDPLRFFSVPKELIFEVNHIKMLQFSSKVGPQAQDDKCVRVEGIVKLPCED